MRKFKRFIRNRYYLTLLLFFVYILVFDTNDLVSQISAYAELYKLRQQKVYYQNDLEETKKQIHELSSNKVSLEKFAREQYRMKRDNEDVFVIVEEGEY